MKITFTQDTAPLFYTGWSAYKKGTKADLRYGQNLIDAGLARAGWGEFIPPLENKDVDFDSLSDAEIKALAKERGIKTGRKGRKRLISELEALE
jgi:hypothetical protein